MTTPSETNPESSSGKSTDTPISTGDSAPVGAPGEPVPDAGAEPVAQASAAQTPPRPLPPLPADYEMPDDYAHEGMIDKATRWARDNPLLAVVAATGAGLLVGRLATSLVPEKKPPTLSERLEKQAKTLRADADKYAKEYSAEARHLAGEAGTALGKRLDRAEKAIKEIAESLSERSGVAAKEARYLADEARDAAEDGASRSRDLANAVGEAVANVVSSKTDSWIDKVRRKA